MLRPWPQQEQRILARRQPGICGRNSGCNLQLGQQVFGPFMRTEAPSLLQIRLKCFVCQGQSDRLVLLQYVAGIVLEHELAATLGHRVATRLGGRDGRENEEFIPRAELLPALRQPCQFHKRQHRGFVIHVNRTEQLEQEKEQGYAQINTDEVSPSAICVHSRVSVFQIYGI
jgi:hypothetical protein